MKKRYTGVLAALAAGVLIFSTGITGEAARTGTITTDGSRVRATADAEGQKVCSLPIDTMVDITDEAESGGKTWYQISFTLDGAQKTGWIRSDLLSVSETEDPAEEQPAESEEQPEESDGGETGSISAGAYTIQEPAEAYTGADSMEQTSVSVGDQTYTAYQSTATDQLYLVWAAKEDGSTGWYWYDPSEETFQQDLGQFSQQGLVTSLQNELTTLKSTTAKSLQQRLYIMIGLGVLSVILLILTIVFAVKSRNAGYEYEDDDNEDDGDISDDSEEQDEEEDDEFEEDEKPKKRRGLFGRRKRDEEEDDDEEDDFDDFVEDVKKKRSEKSKKWADEDEDYSGESAYDDAVYDKAAYDEEDLSLTANLPKIDLSALDEAVEKPKKTEKPKAEEPKAEEPTDADDDLDIEILDLDDLNL